MTFASFAQENFSFSELIAPDGSGLEKLGKMHAEAATTHQTVDELVDKIELLTTLLNNAVIRRVRELPPEKGMVMLKSHQLWWKYFDSVHSMPNCSGSGHGIETLSMDLARLKYRWRAVNLPYQEYLVYAKIANFCQVRLDCGTYQMRFGEVCVKKLADWFLDDKTVEVYGKYYHDFPTGILPESCRAVTLGNETFYLAVLDDRKADGMWQKSFYLCSWDGGGLPLAVHVLEDFQTLAALAVSGNGKITIRYENARKEQVEKSFSVRETNSAAIRSGEMR